MEKSLNTDLIEPRMRSKLSYSFVTILLKSVRFLQRSFLKRERCLSLKDQYVFFLTLKRFVHLNLSPLDALCVFVDGRKTPLARFVLSLQPLLLAGYSLTQALEAVRWRVDPMVCHLLRLGERSHDFLSAISHVLDYLESARVFQKNLWASLRYPLLAMGVLMASMVFLVGAFMPHFEALSSENGLTSSKVMRVLFSLYALDEVVWTVCVVGLLSLWVVGWIFFKTPSGSFVRAWCLDHMPFVGAMRRMLEWSYFFDFLARGMRSKATLVEAFERASHVFSTLRRKKWAARVLEGLQKGLPLSFLCEGEKAIFRRLLPLLRSAEKTGNADIIYEAMSSFFRDEHAMIAERFKVYVGPFFLILVSLLFIGLIQSVINPFYAQIFSLEGMGIAS